MTNKLFNRTTLDVLEEWKESARRKPIIIRGARQVGKSSLVRMFSQGYERYAELNLEKPSHARIFQRGLSIADLVQTILLECRVPPGDSPLLLFIDEIQEVPEAVAALRFFYEERPDIHLVAAGSLLEVALDATAISFPVGRVEFLYLRPLSFDEFLGAMGESLAQEALRSVPTPSYAHVRLLELFHTYVLVGGMPEAVVRYSETHDILAVNRVYADLFAAFADDISKYGRNETMRRLLLHGLETAPFQAGSRITFQGFGGSNYRSREMGEALRTLARTMLLEIVYPTVQGTLPLMSDLRKSPRLQFLDVGLLNHAVGSQKQIIGIRDLSEVYRGRLIEQVVGQEIKTIDLRSDEPLKFWVRDKGQSQAEVDFLIQTNRGVVPLEVKSGAAGRLRSLHEFLKRYTPPLAVRLYAGTYAEHPIQVGDSTHRLLNIPYYATSLLPQYMNFSNEAAKTSQAKRNSHTTL